jgi:hypothetical protein
LKLLESGAERARLNGSSRSAVVSSRERVLKVEFVNHPRAVSLSTGAQWAKTAGWYGGWGAPDRLMNRGAAHVSAWHWSFGAGIK